MTWCALLSLASDLAAASGDGDTTGDPHSSALGLPESRVATGLERLDQDDLAVERAPDATEALVRRVPGVQADPTTGNRFQRNITFRGFTASPILGSPVGLSVYLDGARINEVFGDTVNWDLVPDAALRGGELVSGPEALFGRNSLGGTLFLETKSGFTFEGTRVGAEGGADHARGFDFEHGGRRDALGWYVQADFRDEDEWRDHSGTRMRRGFAKLSHRSDTLEFDLSGLYAKNDLTGNALSPERVFRQDRKAAYTFPDTTINEVLHLSFHARSPLGDATELRVTSFVRDFQRDTRNGDVELECAGAAIDDLPAALCGDFGGDLDPEAEDRTTGTDSRTYAGRAEILSQGALLGYEHALRLGLSFEVGATDFDQAEAEGLFSFDGLNVGVDSNSPFRTTTSVRTELRVMSLFAREVVEVTPQVSVLGALRLEHVKTRLRNRGAPEDESLRGSHSFARLTPGIGVLYRPWSWATIFASYRQGWRVPTPAELTCADPEDPCNLPNAFVADPPLDPVVAKTWEAGVRGRSGDGLRWSLAAFNTVLEDDLLFVQSEVGGAGFFRNVRRTLRRGGELALEGRSRKLDWFASYQFLDARYGSSALLASPVEAGGVAVRSGDRLPGFSRHGAKLGAIWRPLNRLELGCEGYYASGQYLRGDDANRQRRVPGFATVHCHGAYEFPHGVRVWARMENLIDTRYEVGGARNFDAFAAEIGEARFSALGAPRRVWFGLGLRF
ncbi:MAG: TonB-dependent receptor [Myxococcales bacterium]|nr:TonB-dependent receptor [Myxococcales bacterium]